MLTLENTVLTELSSCLHLFLTGAEGEILHVLFSVLLCWAPGTQVPLGFIAGGHGPHPGPGAASDTDYVCHLLHLGMLDCFKL